MKQTIYKLVIWILVFGNGASSAAQEQEVLTEGSIIERELAGGQMHTYQVTVTSGQYLRVTAERQRINVLLRMFTSDNEKLVENAVGPYLPAGVSTIARMSGSYRVEVTSRDAATIRGSYKVNVVELREATSKDERRLAAERAVIEGRRLMGRPDAVAKLGAALEVWRSIGDRKGEAEALWFLGLANRNLGKLEQARGYYNRTLGFAVELGYLSLEASLYHALGQISAELSEWQTALDSYDLALQLCRRTGNRAVERLILNSLAGTYEDLGDFQKALSYFEEQLPITLIERDRRGEAFVVKDIGRMHFALGDKQKAADHFERAKAIAHQVDSGSEAWMLLQIGNHFLVTAGESERALDYYRRALLIYQAENNRPAQAGVLNNIAKTYQDMREKQKALDSFEQSLALCRETGDRGAEAYALNNIGYAHYDFGELQRALVFEEKALILHRELGIRMGVNRSLNDLAKIHVAFGNKPKAISLNEELLTLSRTTDDRTLEADILCTLASLERDIGNLDEARRHIESAVQIAESTRANFSSPDLRSRYFVFARKYYELYIDVLMLLHQNNPTGEFDTVALEAGESARARSLLDLLVEAHADIRRGMTSELIERDRALQGRINDKAQEQRQLLNGKHTAEHRDAVDADVRALLKEREELDAKIRATSPSYASLTRPSSLSLKEIQQQLLDPDSVLLEYALGHERSYLWLVTPNSVASYFLPKRAEIERLARSVSELLTARQRMTSETVMQYRARVSAADLQYKREATALSAMLFGQVVSQLGKKRLLIVADGALQYLSFAALPLPGAVRPLIFDHEIVSLPSASVLAVLRRDTAHRAPADMAVAVLADPVFDDNDPRVKTMRRDESLRGGERPSAIDLRLALRGFDLGSDEGSVSRLPFTRREADAIFSVAPAGAIIKAVDFDANRELATGAELSRYRIVHFATHALLNGEHPELSGIVLSLVDKQGRSRNGFVRLHDIYNLNLPAELVVLSACKTALGKEIRGEGLIGLTRGFMYAGTRRVIASLWKVDDWATAELMKRFYRKMLIEKKRPAAALQAAQIEMWRQPKWRAPYYWAAFTLQGEPN